MTHPELFTGSEQFPGQDREEEALPIPAMEPGPSGSARGDLELLIITGMSGAGRTNAAHVLEDSGWYVVDNLPAKLITSLVRTMTDDHDTTRVGVVVDVRSGEFYPQLQEALKEVEAAGVRHRLLFLDATDEALVRRFESVRRPHPLQGNSTVLDGIRAERAALAGLRASSDSVLDTSRLNVHELAMMLREDFAQSGPALRLTVMSFGFKYGIPLDADLVADVRFLPNPFWIPDLRPLTGQDPRVSEFVLRQEGAQEFLSGYASAIQPVLAGYARENKSYATLAVGCTGGKHRSVAMSEQLAQRLRGDSVAVNVVHRDLGQE